jgi:hypothetical protein
MARMLLALSVHVCLSLNLKHNKTLMLRPGTFGVAKKTHIYSVKVIGSSGRGTISSTIAGIDFVAQDAANRTCPMGAVVNMSFGGRKVTAVNQAVCGMPPCLRAYKLIDLGRRSGC